MVIVFLILFIFAIFVIHFLKFSPQNLLSLYCPVVAILCSNYMHGINTFLPNLKVVLLLVLAYIFIIIL